MDELLDEVELSHRRRQTRHAVATFAVVAVATWLVQFIEIESVLATGPLVCIAGIVAIIAGVRGRVPSASLLGALGVVLPLALLWAVMFFNWSPGRAERPFAIVGTLCLAVVLGLTWRAWTRCAPPAPVVVPTSTMMPVPTVATPADRAAAPPLGE